MDLVILLIIILIVVLVLSVVGYGGRGDGANYLRFTGRLLIRAGKQVVGATRAPLSQAILGKAIPKYSFS